MFDFLIRLSLRSRALVLGVFAILAGVALIAWRSMPINVFPAFATPRVVIGTTLPGMAPRDMEALVTYPIETAVSGTTGIRVVRSKTTLGVSLVTVVFHAGTNIYHDRQLIAERLQNLQSRLPTGVDGPEIFPLTSAIGWLVKYSLTSPVLPAQELRTLADWVIRPRLLSVGGVADVADIGGAVTQYQIALDPTAMQAYRISVGDVARAVRGVSRDLPGGLVETSGQQLIVSAAGRLHEGDALSRLRHTLAATRGGLPITLAQVAHVRRWHAIRLGAAALGQAPAVVGTVYKAYGAGTITTTRHVLDTLRAARRALPPGVTMNTHIFRQSTFIKAAIHNLWTALWQGALIVILVLLVFLANWRASLATFVALPASFTLGALILYAFHAGVNAMTLGGLAVAIGEVVDNGIITVENIVRRLRLAHERSGEEDTNSVILHAMREVLNSIVYATAIVILVFLPVFFMHGIPGRIFSPLGISYLATMLASLIVSVTLVPALCSLLFSRFGQRGPGAERETGLVRFLKRHYLRLLERVLPWTRTIAVLALVAVLAAGASLAHLGRSFLPPFHEGNYILIMTTLPGTPWRESMRLGAVVRRDLAAFPQIVSVDQLAGAGTLTPGANTPNNSEFDLRIDFHRGPQSPHVLLGEIRRRLATIPGAAFNLGEFIAHRIDNVESGVPADVAVKIYGPHLRRLYSIGKAASRVIAPVPGVVDLHLEQQIRVPQIVITPRRGRDAHYGVSAGRLLRDINLYLNDTPIGHVLHGPRRFAITLRVAHGARRSARVLRRLPVDAPALGPHAVVPLAELASVQVRPVPFEIRRAHGHRVLLLTFDVAGRALSSVVHEVKTRMAKVSLPRAYFVRYGGTFRSQERANTTLWRLGLLAIIVSALLLQKAFGSLRDALLVLVNLPLAMVGGVAALLLTGSTLSTAAVIGFIALFGITARNGIILISHYKTLETDGRSVDEVVKEGTLGRLIPILMTSIAPALGLLPLLWGSPVGKELERPLAFVVLGGLVTSTALNLIVIPSVYRALRWRDQARTRGTPA
ncbi:MAG: efflux RND transporter permease subunit [Acidiferrobacter sp.]